MKILVKIKRRSKLPSNFLILDVIIVKRILYLIKDPKLINIKYKPIKISLKIPNNVLNISYKQSKPYLRYIS